MMTSHSSLSIPEADLRQGKDSKVYFGGERNTGRQNETGKAVNICLIIKSAITVNDQSLIPCLWGPMCNRVLRVTLHGG